MGSKVGSYLVVARYGTHTLHNCIIDVLTEQQLLPIRCIMSFYQRVAQSEEQTCVPATGVLSPMYLYGSQ